MPPFRIRPLLWLAFLAIVCLLEGCATSQPQAKPKPTPAPSPFPIPQATFERCFAERQGCFVLIRCSDGKTVEFNPTNCQDKLPPCSTFKIWNTLIGLETGLISQPDEPFYKWDGQKRFIPEWNRDLTLREAFQASCVPAYQALARRIGKEQMQSWLDTIHYGDRDTSAGIDVFWLSSTRAKTLLITPREQAQLIRQLVTGQLPFSKKSRATLESIMQIRPLKQGVLCGKTGSGVDGHNQYNLGWFVGYLRDNQETYAFACVLRGAKQSGKDARTLVETLVTEAGWQ
jgi:beta-lactamase class D